MKSVLIACLFLSGCATKHAYVNVDIPLPCIHKVGGIHCTPDLLHCEKFQITHDKGCEIISTK